MQRAGRAGPLLPAHGQLGRLCLGTGKQPLCEEFGGGSRAGREPGSAAPSRSLRSGEWSERACLCVGRRAAAARGAVMPLSLARDKGAHVARRRTAAPSRGPDSGKHRNPVITPCFLTSRRDLDVPHRPRHGRRTLGKRPRRGYRVRPPGRVPADVCVSRASLGHRRASERVVICRALTQFLLHSEGRQKHRPAAARATEFLPGARHGEAVGCPALVSRPQLGTGCPDSSGPAQRGCRWQAGLSAFSEDRPGAQSRT